MYFLTRRLKGAKIIYVERRVRGAMFHYDGGNLHAIEIKNIERQISSLRFIIKEESRENRHRHRKRKKKHIQYLEKLSFTQFHPISTLSGFSY